MVPETDPLLKCWGANLVGIKILCELYLYFIYQDTFLWPLGDPWNFNDSRRSFNVTNLHTVSSVVILHIHWIILMMRQCSDDVDCH